RAGRRDAGGGGGRRRRRGGRRRGSWSDRGRRRAQLEGLATRVAAREENAPRREDERRLAPHLLRGRGRDGRRDRQDHVHVEREETVALDERHSELRLAPEDARVEEARRRPRAPERLQDR